MRYWVRQLRERLAVHDAADATDRLEEDRVMRAAQRLLITALPTHPTAAIVELGCTPPQPLLNRFRSQVLAVISTLTELDEESIRLVQERQSAEDARRGVSGLRGWAGLYLNELRDERHELRLPSAGRCYDEQTGRREGLDEELLIPTGRTVSPTVQLPMEHLYVDGALVHQRDENRKPLRTLHDPERQIERLALEVMHEMGLGSSLQACKAPPLT